MGMTFEVDGADVDRFRRDGFAGSGRGRGSRNVHAPPKGLKQVGEHWPRGSPAGDRRSTSVRPATRCGTSPGNGWEIPHLWPQVWDPNRYILDSHWIYPGDPLAVARKAQPSCRRKGRRRPVGRAAAGRGRDDRDRRRGTRRRLAPSLRLPRMAMIQLADEHDLYCSGWVETDPPAFDADDRQGGRKHEQATGDIVYLNQGRTQGIAAGASMHGGACRSPVMPATHEHLGTYMQRMVTCACSARRTTRPPPSSSPRARDPPGRRGSSVERRCARRCLRASARRSMHGTLRIGARMDRRWRARQD